MSSRGIAMNTIVIQIITNFNLYEKYSHIWEYFSYKLKFVNNLFYNQICRYKWIKFQILPYKYVDNAELSI